MLSDFPVIFLASLSGALAAGYIRDRLGLNGRKISGPPGPMGPPGRPGTVHIYDMRSQEINPQDLN